MTPFTPATPHPDRANLSVVCGVINVSLSVRPSVGPTVLSVLLSSPAHRFDIHDTRARV